MEPRALQGEKQKKKGLHKAFSYNIVPQDPPQLIMLCASSMLRQSATKWHNIARLAVFDM